MQDATAHRAKGARLSAIGLAVLLLVALVGCANPARPDKMAVEVGEHGMVAADSALYQAVTVADVRGGLETDRYWGYPAIDNPEIEGALRLSLANHAMLAEGRGRFALDATLVEFIRPAGGFDMTVMTATHYRLTEVASGRTVFDETLVTYFTADFTSHLIGVERLRLANDGAMRMNIGAFIERLREQSESGSPLISLNGRSLEALTIASIAVEDARASHAPAAGH